MMRIYVYYAGRYDDGEYVDVPNIWKLQLLIKEFASPVYIIPPEYTDAGHWQMEVINVLEFDDDE